MFQRYERCRAVDCLGLNETLSERAQGAVERMGLGPDVCLRRNPRLVYTRLTGRGQDGLYTQMAGHDINYIALSGVLHAICPREDPPVPPLNLVGNSAAELSITRSTWLARFSSAADRAGADLGRGGNIMDGGGPYYAAYETSD